MIRYRPKGLLGDIREIETIEEGQNLRPVRQNFAFAADNQSGETITWPLLRPGNVCDEEVDEILEFLKFTDHADEFASALSGGQRKFLKLGRVLVLEPNVILFDEPVAGVNPSLTDNIITRLQDLNDQRRAILQI